ncbi:hypothetical protein ACKTEK_05285 [Tepidamorphus sp. 3E244]|uniref:hypothetical protein n=1 Tax=Tepidamorphus sp. 3E244 TaxID=3385498 RepID=UPI0038FCFB26
MMNSSLIAAIGAGLAAALLFLSLTTGSMLALVLFYLAPLPIFIAGFGWGLPAALIASGVATLSVALGASFTYAGIFALTVCAPTIWLARLAMLARPVDETDPNSPREWYPAGRLVLWTAALGAAFAMFTAYMLGGDVETFLTNIDLTIREGFLGGRAAPEGVDLDLLINLLSRMLIPASAAIWTATTLLNLTLAIRLTALSGRSQRERLGLGSMQFGPVAVAAFALSIAAALLGDTVGLYSKAAVGALTTAFIVLGFATVYGLTRNSSMQGLILSGLAALMLLLPFAFIVVALLGVADALFGLRARFSAAPPANPND